ncbi:MAG: hypothetical protein ABL894_05305, partial [Hyphomicrobium sp.]
MRPFRNIVTLSAVALIAAFALTSSGPTYAKDGGSGSGGGGSGSGSNSGSGGSGGDGDSGGDDDQ